jgi:hypothetical protein
MRIESAGLLGGRATAPPPAEPHAASHVANAASKRLIGMRFIWLASRFGKGLFRPDPVAQTSQKYPEDQSIRTISLT